MTGPQAGGVSPVVAQLAERLVVELAPEHRTGIVAAVRGAGGTGADGQDERRRYMALDWIVRTWLPEWLELAAADDPADAVRDLPRIDGPADVQRAGSALAALRPDLDAAAGRSRVNEFVNRPVMLDDREEETDQAAKEANLAVLAYLLPEHYISINPPLPPPRPGDVWSGGQDAVWSVAPPDPPRELSRRILEQLVEQQVRWAVFRRAQSAAGTAARAWDNAWIADKNASTAHAAARSAVRPRPRDTAVWSTEPAARGPWERGRRENRRLRSAPPGARAAAVFDAAQDALQHELTPLLTELGASAVGLLAGMTRLRPATPPAATPPAAAPRTARPSAAPPSVAPPSAAGSTAGRGAGDFGAALRSGDAGRIVAVMDELGSALDGPQPARARELYQRALGSHHADVVPHALLRLGRLSELEGDVTAARTFYVRAIATGHPTVRPAARTAVDRLDA